MLLVRIHQRLFETNLAFDELYPDGKDIQPSLSEFYSLPPTYSNPDEELKVADMDISRELLGYEVEYHVLQEEMFPYQDQGTTRKYSAVDCEMMNKMENVNKNLKRQVP